MNRRQAVGPSTPSNSRDRRRTPRGWVLLACATLLAVTYCSFVGLHGRSPAADPTPEPNVRAAAVPGLRGARTHTFARIPTESAHDSFIEQLEGQVGDEFTDLDEAAVAEWLAALPADDFAVVLERLGEDDPLPQRETLVSFVLSRWAIEAPDEAVAWVCSLGDLAPRRRYLEQTLGTWAANDPVAASRWSRQSAPRELRDISLWTVAQRLAAVEPSEAAALAELVEDSRLRQQAVSHIAMVWSTQAPGQALVWAQDLDTGAAREAARRQIILVLADRDPVLAARMAVQSLAQGSEQDRAVIGVVQRWAGSAPGDTAAWVREFPPGALGATAVESLVRRWSSVDAAAAAAWILGLPPGRVRDGAAGAYAGALSPVDATSALEWIGFIQDDATRDAAAHAVGANLQRW